MKKDIIIFHCSDRFACSWYRQRFVSMLLMTDRAGEVKPVVSPFGIADDHVLSRTAAVVFGRTYSEQSGGAVIRHYIAKRKKYGFNGMHHLPPYQISISLSINARLKNGYKATLLRRPAFFAMIPKENATAR